MHALDLAELAAIVARYSPNMIAHRTAPPRVCQQKYWLEAKFRHDFWSSKLATHRQEVQCLGVTHRRQCWQRILPIIEDILVSEPLTRSIAYHARLLADQLIDVDFSTLANSVLSSHIEARHRCLHLLVFGEGLSVEHSVRLNRIRRELEGYTDGLLATFPVLESARSICFDAGWTRQMRDHANGFANTAWIDARGLHLDCLRQSLRPSMARRLAATLPCSASNSKIHVAVMGFLANDIFDSLGMPLGERMARLIAESKESSPAAEFFESPQATTITQLMSPLRPSSESSASENRRWK
jgi:hypothetical protein